MFVTVAVWLVAVWLVVWLVQKQNVPTPAPTVAVQSVTTYVYPVVEPALKTCTATPEHLPAIQHLKQTQPGPQPATTSADLPVDRPLKTTRVLMYVSHHLAAAWLAAAVFTVVTPAVGLLPMMVTCAPTCAVLSVIQR